MEGKEKEAVEKGERKKQGQTARCQSQLFFFFYPHSLFFKCIYLFYIFPVAIAAASLGKAMPV